MRNQPHKQKFKDKELLKRAKAGYSLKSSKKQNSEPENKKVLDKLRDTECRKKMRNI